MQNCPAVSDAARKLPGAEIDWVVEQPFAGVAAMHAAVRRVIPVAMRRWRAAPWNPAVWSEMRDFRRLLRAERYDAVIDTQSLLKSALISALSRGTRHGMDRASAREPLAARFYDVRHAVPRELHAVERNRRLSAASLGYTIDASVDYGLHPAGDTPSKNAAPYAVLLTMTSRAGKLWPEASWIELGRALATQVVLPWGSEAERRRAERIAAAIGSAAVPPRLQLDQLTGLFLKARSVVGVDTGLTHFAAALGVSTVGIYCGSDPALTGLYGAARAKNVGARDRPPQAAEVLKSLS